MFERDRVAHADGTRGATAGGAAGTVHREIAVTPRSEAIGWARAVVEDPGLVYLDTETTGLDRSAEILEIAILDAAGRVVLETLVRPLGSVPPAASAIHGIRAADLARAPIWPEIHAHVVTALAGRRVIVYNAAFDRRMVEQSAARHALLAPTPVWSCAMGRYASFRGVVTAGGSYRRHKLNDAVETFGGPTPSHRAAGDARACRAIVVGMANTRP